MPRIIALVLTPGFTGTNSVAASGDELHRLSDEYWDHEMEINPFAATNAGVNLFNDLVPDVSPAPHACVLEARKRYRIRLVDADLSAADANHKRGDAN